MFPTAYPAGNFSYLPEFEKTAILLFLIWLLLLGELGEGHLQQTAAKIFCYFTLNKMKDYNHDWVLVCVRGPTRFPVVATQSKSLKC